MIYLVKMRSCLFDTVLFHHKRLQLARGRSPGSCKILVKLLLAILYVISSKETSKYHNIKHVFSVFKVYTKVITHLLLDWLRLRSDLERRADRYVVCLHDVAEVNI